MISNNRNFDLSEEYYYYQDLAKKMTRCCKLGRDISVNEAYYYLHLHCVKCFKDACISCIKDNEIAKEVMDELKKTYNIDEETGTITKIITD